MALWQPTAKNFSPQQFRRRLTRRDGPPSIQPHHRAVRSRRSGCNRLNMTCAASTLPFPAAHTMVLCMWPPCSIHAQYTTTSPSHGAPNFSLRCFCPIPHVPACSCQCPHGTHSEPYVQGAPPTGNCIQTALLTNVKTAPLGPHCPISHSSTSKLPMGYNISVTKETTLPLLSISTNPSYLPVTQSKLGGMHL